MSYPLLLLCGPSGAGKTTVVRLLRQLRPELHVGVTYTTRPQRRTAREDKELHTVSQAAFQQLLQESAFVEHAQFAGHWYGTAKTPLEQALARGPVLLNLELAGIKQVKQLYPEAITIFLEPGSLQILEQRLKERSDYDPAAVTARLARAQADWAAADWFERRVVNPEGRPEQAADALAAILDESLTNR